jgi:hypothetical protein
MGKDREETKVCVADENGEVDAKFETLDPIKTPTPEEVSELFDLLRELRTSYYHRRSNYMSEGYVDGLARKEEKMRKRNEEKEEIVVRVLEMLGQERIIDLVEGSNEELS